MIYVGLPVGSNYGWGVLGKEIALELSQRADVCLLMPPGLEQNVNDELDLYRLKRLMPSPQEALRMQGNSWTLPGPVILAAFGKNLDPFVPQVAPPYQVGFAVFEENVLPAHVVQTAKELYHHLAAGSTYCAEVLRQHGLMNVSVVLHGVDTRVFHARAEERTFFRDRFVVFSGGKFELRKGQDIVIRAYKVLQDRHADVMLVTSWFNPWPATRDTMQSSRLIRYRASTANDYFAWLHELLAENGIDVERVLNVGPRDNRLLPHVYHATDVGLFPNRVEGGTNMVLMEYLACGKPAVAAYNSGHKDIVRQECALLIERHHELKIEQGGELQAIWSEPDLDETIEKLEWAYRNREEINALGKQAAEDMKAFTWGRVAEGLLARVRDLS